jgi:VIT1/CCC1 family predicted Fe2+/Mn2+ transporter
MPTKKQPQTKRANARVIEQAKSGTARAALLGVSDGLVTNVSFILGVAGAGVGPQFVRVAGLASLIAGAGSMAVGEYISMRGQVELLESVLSGEEVQLKENPKEAKAALKEVLIEDGMSETTATAGSNEVAANSAKAMAMYARGKLGINPDELGSAWGAAGSSLVMFSLGAFVPLVPWFFGGGVTAILTSLGLSIITALGIGAYLGYTTGGHMLRPALRQLFVLVLAAGVTYGIGRLFHVRVG